MAKKDKKSLLPDRKNAPKRTGKRLPPPLDPVSDFETPTRKEPEISGKDKAAGEQPELLEVREEPKPTVVGDRIEASYLKPIFSKQPKSGDKLISLAMTFALTDEHIEFLPKIVQNGYKVVRKHGSKRFDIDVPGQTARFFISPNEKEELIGLPAARVVNASLAVIQKKGDGEAIKVISFAFRLQVPFSREVAKFAEINFGQKFWITLVEAEPELFDEEAEE